MARHIHQQSWRKDGKTSDGADKLVVNGKSYVVRYGDPGGCNNCLIDSLRQCLYIQSDNRAVRKDLQAQFALAPGAAKVTAHSYLEVHRHATSIVQGLFKYNSSNRPKDVDVRDFCVVALSANSENGDVVGDVNAPHQLLVMNYDNVHFDAVIPL